MNPLPHCSGAIRTLALLILAFGIIFTAEAQFLSDPQPGNVWREYSRVLTGDKPPRVTDPNTTNATAQTYLPNPVNTLTLGSVANAVRAEFVASVWGGHVGTTGKKFRFNGGPWITIPEMGVGNGIPAGTNGQCYMQQLTYVIPFPAAYLNPANSYALKQGTNTFEGTSGGQSCYSFGWGQWMWYEVMVRVYHNPAATPHTAGSVTAPAAGGTIGENPTVSASVIGTATLVDFLAYYRGPDTDGDGVFEQYHHAYHRLKSETAMLLKNHVGSDNSAPFSVTWNTSYVPDQTAGGIRFKARIKDNTNTWYMTPEVAGVTLQRIGSYVRMYTTTNMPERCWVRSGRTTKTVNFTIPPGDNLANATSATLVVPTWNGDDVSERPLSWMKVNATTLPDFGQDHYYSLDFLTISRTALVQGTNSFTIYASTVEHGIELLWPGPMVVVRYGGSPTNTPPAVTEHPANQTVPLGGSATFVVAATGTPPLSYQWQKNGTQIPGATGASYTTPAVAAGDNGSTFRCVITNPYGSATSSSATLTVTSGALPPVITTEPVNRTVTAGQTATFSVIASGSTPLTYVWLKNGAAIAGAAGASYTTPATMPADNGSSFGCIVSNAAGADTSVVAILTVSSTPPPGANIVANPGFESGTAPWTFYTDGSGSLASVASGFESPRTGRVSISTAGTNVQLYQNNLALDPNTDYVVSFNAYSTTGRDFSVSLLQQVSPYTNYGLNAVVFNLGTTWQFFSRRFRTSGFSAPVNNVRLRFWLGPYDAAGEQYFIDGIAVERVGQGEPPVIVAHPQNQTVTVGFPATFTVSATGTAPLSYQWSRNGVPIPGAASASYTTPPAALSDNGAAFDCLITNAAGSILSNDGILTVLSDPPGGGPWWNRQWTFRVRLEADAGGTSRTDHPLEVRMNFTSLLKLLGQDGAFNDSSLRVIEVGPGGVVLDSVVPAQFDKDSLYNATTRALGTLVFPMRGLTAGSAVRFYDVYFDTSGGFAPPPAQPGITVADSMLFQGQESFRITTPAATYYYHKSGGGFAGMVDVDGNEWIGYRPGGGSAGEYRGIPNTGEVFHPGYTNSSSRLLHTGPLKLTLQSISTNGAWEGTWEVFQRFARFRMGRIAANYWFLYEGTPGGSFGATTDYVVRSNGMRTRADVTWAGDLAAPEWAYFGDGTMRRILFVAHHENDGAPDMYRQMDGNMTVFGFGRDNVPCCPKFLNSAPRHFTIGFGEDSSFAAASGLISAATLPVTVTLAPPEFRPVSEYIPLPRAEAGEAAIPDRFGLEQNFPNPFNSSTVIRYALAHPAEVTLAVYDLLGRRVATLVRGIQAAGRYEVYFDATGLPSGVYVCHYQAGTFSENRRLLLLR